jgi:Ser/Thr protein kinase RdoA (MazF antagonist)
MLMEDFGSAARDTADVDFTAILSAYGKLQRDSAAHLDELFKAGCIDRRLPVLVEQIDPLLSDPTTQSVLDAVEYEQLVALAPQLKERCAQVAAYNIPPALIHGDLHLGNVTRRDNDMLQISDLQSFNGYLFFDWTDACIGLPFLDLFLLYFPDEEFRDGEGTDPLAGRDAYLAAWRDVASRQRLLEAWELAKPLCALHHSVSYLTIVNNLEPLVREELMHGLPDNLHRLLASMRA